MFALTEYSRIYRAMQSDKCDIYININKYTYSMPFLLLQPEWYFTQILNWLRDHLDFLDKKIQPLLRETGNQAVDAKVSVWDEIILCDLFGILLIGTAL